jgi:hypothetical protein
VPDANLGIVMSASRTRRQMIQRMGRILRRKQPGIAARFVIMYAQDTLEDPANHIERDGFLDEIERIADASGVFESGRFEQLAVFLGAPGPLVVPEPERVTNAELDAAFELLGTQTAPPDPDDAPYLELELSNLPVIAKPRVEPKKLSTGREPLEIARIGNAWRISCTGCGEASPLVEFRWQVLDQTVACRC